MGNACLAFLTGMDIAARMIERGDIEYALIVDGEVSNEITERTIERLNAPDATADQFRDEFASLTLGSGAAAMVLGHSGLLPAGHRYRGGVSLGRPPQFSHLCRGTMDRMVTDSAALLDEGLKLAAETYRMAGATLGWAAAELDEFAVHQVSKVHTDGLIDRLGHRSREGCWRCIPSTATSARRRCRSCCPSWTRPGGCATERGWH